ncbi:MAG: PQQ-binding-like beta-propeller repeat protein [Acidobacteriota bacterium]
MHTVELSRRLVRVAVVVSLLAPLSAAAQQPPDATPMPLWGPNGPVYALARVGDTLLVGGQFDVVGPVTGGFAIVSATDASTRATPALGNFTTVIADDADGWFVASGAAQTATAAVHHLLANGLPAPGWTVPTITGGVTGMVNRAGRLFVAGVSVVNGTARPGIAALDATTGTLLPWAPVLDAASRVGSVAASADAIIINGSFVTVDGVARPGGIAALDATSGVLLPFTLPAQPYSYRFDAAASRVVVAAIGCGTTTNRNEVCAFALDGQLLWSWLAPFTSDFTRLYATSDRVYVAMSGGTSQLFALDAASGAERLWSPPSIYVDAMRAEGSRLYVSGSTPSGGRVLSLDRITGAASDWDPVVGGRVNTIAVAGGQVALGGGFTSVGGGRHANLAAIDLRTGRAVARAPDAPMPIFALAASSGVVFAGGGKVSSVDIGNIFAFSSDTGQVYPWSLAPNGEVRAMAVAGRRLFIGGDFNVVSGQYRERLMAVDTSTGALLPWAPQPGFHVSELVASDTALYAAGSPSERPGGPLVTAFDLRTEERLPFSPTLNNGAVTRRLGGWKDRVLATSRFGYAPQAFGFSWLHPTSGDTLEVVPLPGSALIAAAAGDLLIIGSGSNPPSGPRLLAVDVPSGRLLPWSPELDPGPITSVQVVLGTPGLVIVGGRFSAIAGQPVNNLAAFRTARPGGPQAITSSVTGNTATLGWRPGLAPTPDSYVVEAGTSPGASDVGRFPVGVATSATGMLGAGTYFARVRGVDEGGEGAASSEVILTFPAVAAPPNTPGALTATVAGHVVTLNWGASSGNPTGYVLDVGTQSGLTNVVSLATGHLDTALVTPAPAGTYFVRLRAANAFGSSAATPEVVVVVP